MIKSLKCLKLLYIGLTMNHKQNKPISLFFCLRFSKKKQKVYFNAKNMQ